MSVDDYFAGQPPFERHIYNLIADHLASIGDDLQVEAVSVGIFFKRARTFAELRPTHRGVRLSLLLSRRLHHPRVVKRYDGTGQRSAVFIDLSSPEDVDDELREWLTEAYASSPT